MNSYKNFEFPKIQFRSKTFDKKSESKDTAYIQARLNPTLSHSYGYMLIEQNLVINEPEMADKFFNIIIIPQKGFFGWVCSTSTWIDYFRFVPKYLCEDRQRSVKCLPCF